jgi:hypothetical protein
MISREFLTTISLTKRAVLHGVIDSVILNNNIVLKTPTFSITCNKMHIYVTTLLYRLF